MKKQELLRRWLVFAFGLTFSALGVAVITRADLGTSPISSVPYVLSLGFAPTLGQFTILFSLLLVAVQCLILGKSFPRLSLLQIPVSVGFGYLIDGAMLLTEWLSPENYLPRLMVLLVGCLILGFGVYLEMTADVVMLPGESTVKAVVCRFGTDFGITKVFFDAALALSAGTISLLLFGRIIGVREGTILSAVTVGLIAKGFAKIFCKKISLRNLSDADTQISGYPQGENSAD